MAGLLGDVMNGLLGENNSGQMYQDALAQYANIKAPTEQDLSVDLANQGVVGQLTPEMIQALNLGDTELAGVETDPRLKADQMAALAQMAGIAQGNPSAADTAGFELARQNAAGNLQSQNAGVLNNMAQRGMAGSGAELIAKLKNNQAQAQQLSNQDMEQAQAMQQARMAALQGQSSMATNLRGQDYSEAANLANARDAIAKYNSSNAQNVQNTNVGAKNAAQATNLNNAQTVANNNTTTANQQAVFNSGAKQNAFQNQTALAGGKAGVYGQQAQNENQQQANNSALIGNLVGAGATAYAKSDERDKTNVSRADNDIEDLLNKLKPYKFQYKNPGEDGEGARTSIMAQDLEKSGAGANLVKDTPHGKMVDTNQAAMLSLASVAHLNNKLNKILGKA